MTQKKSKSKAKYRIILNRIFNVKEWSDWARIKSGGTYIKDATQKLFVLKPARPVESFEEAQMRLKLTDEAIASRCRSLFRLSMMMLCLSIILFFYALYHFIYGTIHAGILTVALSSLSAAMAFRYHFWYFQIKTRKLGSTFREWYRQGLLGENHE